MDEITTTTLRRANADRRGPSQTPAAGNYIASDNDKVESQGRCQGGSPGANTRAADRTLTRNCRPTRQTDAVLLHSTASGITRSSPGRETEQGR